MGNARRRDQSGAHGVELDVKAVSEKISLVVDRCRSVASLSQRADSTVGGIDVSDVASAEGLHRAWQAAFVARCHQQMRVVGDQHIAMDRAIIGRCGLREPGAGMMVGDASLCYPRRLQLSFGHTRCFLALSNAS